MAGLAGCRAARSSKMANQSRNDAGSHARGQGKGNGKYECLTLVVRNWKIRNDDVCGSPVWTRFELLRLS